MNVEDTYGKVTENVEKHVDQTTKSDRLFLKNKRRKTHSHQVLFSFLLIIQEREADV